MKTIYRQRQGSSENDNTNNSTNRQLGYYIGMETWKYNKYRIIIASKRDKTDNKFNYR